MDKNKFKIYLKYSFKSKVRSIYVMLWALIILIIS